MKELRVMCQAWGESTWLGTLADDGSDVLFQYSPEAIQRGVELSPIKLPLRANAYPDKPTDYLPLSRVPGVIHDSLPDGWGLSLMDRRLRAKGIDTDTVSILDRLAYLGDNTMGALTYEPAFDPLIDNKDLTLISLAKEIQALITDDSHKVLDELAKAGGSPGGARPKAVVYYNPDSIQMSTHAGQVRGEQAWLVKFPAKEDPTDSCALEELYARIARQCGLGMGPTQFFALPEGLTAFGTRRFDRIQGQRVHVHSLAGMLHVNFQIPSLGYGEFLRTTRTLTHDAQQIKKALQRCIFNVLMNNRDDHAKNLAFLLNADQAWELAPPFDLTYCAGYRGEHFMDIAGEGKNPARADVLKVAAMGGMNEKEAGEVIDEMLACVTNGVLKVAASELPILKKTLSTVLKVIDANRGRLA